MSVTIRRLYGRQILDSRGNPTVEVECELSDGGFGRAGVPSGASTGSHEALELRDGDKALYAGKSVLKAVRNVNDVLAPSLVGKDLLSQSELDRALIGLDGTPNKANLGANAILGASMALARARARSQKQPLWQSLADQYGVKDATVLPVPLMNVINGGKHADSGLSFQECMLVPTGFSRFSDALRAGTETFHVLRGLLHKAGHVTAVGDEGGFAPHVKGVAEAFDLLLTAIDKAGYKGKIQLGIDAAASECYSNGTYTVDGKEFSTEGLTEFYAELCQKYPLISIEDSHSEDDWLGFQLMHEKLGQKIQLVGDDLLVTNVERMKEALQKKAANAVLVKVNQIGTVSEAVDAIQLAQKNKWGAIVSHRSGETEDTFIADLAVGLRAGQIKTGSLSRSERVAKYNQLLRIEEQLGTQAQYAQPFQR